MHQFGWLSERGGKFQIRIRKRVLSRKGGSLGKGSSNPGGNYANLGVLKNLIFSKTETAVKHSSSFLIKSAMQSEHNNQKIENKCNV